MFSLVSNQLKLKELLCFCCLRINRSHIQRVQILFRRSAVFLQKLRINNPNTGSRDLMTLTLREGEMTGWGGVQSVAICTVTTRCH